MRYEDFGEAIKKRMARQNIRINDAASRLGTQAGINSSVARESIAYYRNGWVYGTASSRSIELNGEVRLYRLSVFMHILDYPEKNQLVRDIKRIDPRFVYPPKSSSRLEARL